MLFKRFLSKQGFRVSVAADSDEMQEITGKWKIDLGVLDRMLPGKDGLAICAELRDALPVIVSVWPVCGGVAGNHPAPFGHINPVFTNPNQPPLFKKG